MTCLILADQMLNGERIFGGPGSGAVSRSLRTGRQSAWSEGDGGRLRRVSTENRGWLLSVKTDFSFLFSFRILTNLCAFGD